jgi:hypothetical protein
MQNQTHVWTISSKVMILLSLKWYLHYGDNRSKLGLFKNAKTIFFVFFKMH